jgi:serine/threonine protein kinase
MAAYVWLAGILGARSRVGTTSMVRYQGCAGSLIADERLVAFSLSVWRRQMFALKTFKTAMDDKAMLSKLIDTEIELLKHLSHPNIVSFLNP